MVRTRLLWFRALWVAVFSWLAVLSSPAQAVVIDWVAVGDPGNVADTTGFGSVAAPYRISRFEITNAQYAEFLNAVAAADPNGLYNTSMGLGSRAGILRSGTSGSFVYTVVTGRGAKPVNLVSFFDAARFANWLHNGQPSGAQDDTTTEDGAYLVPATSVPFTRNPGAQVFIPSEDQWYKAAYYDPGTGSYFTSPLSTNSGPLCTLPGASLNIANCNFIVMDVTDVGAYTGSPSPSGTFDQGGNVAEWNETLISSFRVRRGGDWADFGIRLFSSFRDNDAQTTEESTLGFRVASGPEPGAPFQEFFTIDPAQSFVQIANTSVFTLEFLGAVMPFDVPLLSQVGAGGTGTLSNGLRTNSAADDSMLAFLEGYMLVSIPVGGGAPMLEIINRRSSLWLIDNGLRLPGLPGSQATPAAAALAAKVISPFFGVEISAAVRGAEFSLGHFGIPELLTDQGGGLFGFSLAGLVCNAVNGSTQLEVLGAFLAEVLGSGRSPLSVSVADIGDRPRATPLALSVADVPPQPQATLLEQPGGGRQLTLPIDLTVVLTDDTFAAGLPISITLDLTGQVIATNARFVPEPAGALAWLAVLGTLATLRRMRRS